jgi:hypothetical protein
MLLLTLWVKNGRAMWSSSVMGRTNNVFPWSRVSWLMAKLTCYWVRGIPVTDQGEQERESANLFGVALWTPTWVFSTYCTKRREEYPWTDRHYCASSSSGAQKS